jgi:biotin carboxyl carrier protein
LRHNRQRLYRLRRLQWRLLRRPRLRRRGPGDEVAPLGGVVQTVHVSVGQAVNEGDKLVSLEAMKMVTHVVAKRGGKVISIAVKPGDPVDAGQALLTIG